MGFNFGALAGGMAEGIESGVNLRDQILARQLKQAQLNAFNNNNLGQQAWTNAQIPGMTPMPQGANPGGGGVIPILQQLPLVGQLGQELGLWGPTPAAAQPPMPSPQGSAPMGGMPRGQPSPAPQPQAGSAPAQAPSQPVGQNAASTTSTGAPSIQDVAMAVDKANPGLRQSNPAAFSEAVKLGFKYAQEQAATALDTRYKESQIAGMGSENKLREAQAANLPVQSDLTRAQIENQRAETDVKKGELLLQPQKLKLEEAKVKLEEAKQEAAQNKMRLDEAEANAKVGDFQSQREWRDAQIANLRSERMLKMQKQKFEELKGSAEITELGSRSKKQEAEAGYYDRKGLTDTDQDKLINQELGKAQVQARFHDNQINDLLTSMNPNDPKIKARIQDHMRSAAAYRERVKTLEGQLSTAPKPTVDNPFEQTEIAPARQTELGKVSQKFLELSKSNDTEGARRLAESMKAKGFPPHEIQWALDNARQLSKTAPMVPQSR